MTFNTLVNLLLETDEGSANSRNWFKGAAMLPKDGHILVKSPKSSTTYAVHFKGGLVTDITTSALGAKIDIEGVKKGLQRGLTLGDALVVSIFYPKDYDFGQEMNRILYGDGDQLPASTPPDQSHQNGSVQ